VQEKIMPLVDRTEILTQSTSMELEIGPPKRQLDENFEDYKIRRKRENASIKRWLKGRIRRIIN